MNLKMEFIQCYMGECHLFINIGSIDDVRQGSEDSLVSYYNHFTNIDQVILEGKVIRDFIRGFGPKGTIMKESH